MNAMQMIDIIEITDPGWDFKFRIVDRRDGIEDKAYTRVAAEQIAASLAARRL